MVTILLMSTKMPTLCLLKINIFLNKDYHVITCLWCHQQNFITYLKLSCHWDHGVKILHESGKTVKTKVKMYLRLIPLTFCFDIGRHVALLYFFAFKILLSKTLLSLIVSQTLFLLNTKIGGSAKISFNFGSIYKICQFLSIIVLRSGRVLLHATVSGKRYVLDVLILFNNAFLGIVIA